MTKSGRFKTVLSGEDRQQAKKDLQVDINPVAEDSQEQRYSNRSGRANPDSPIQYDQPQTDTERIQLKAENEKLYTMVTDLKYKLAEKDVLIVEIDGNLQETNELYLKTEADRQEWHRAVEELAESSGKGEDREKKAWDKLARLAGWSETRSKEVKERLAKAIYKKKGFF